MMTKDQLNKYKKIIHIAKRQCELTDDQYSALLEGAANISSCSELKTIQQYSDIMTAFKNYGFKFTKPKNNRPLWDGEWRCSEAIRAKIEVMWRTVSRTKTDKSLASFIQRITDIESPKWIDNHMAAQIVQALNKMYKTAGLNSKNGKPLKPEALK